ncbi:MAG: RNA-binding domain-containing protein [Phycisphaeraceae bacterium]
MIPMHTLLTTETDRIEWKLSTDIEGIYLAVCAFANDLANTGKPGYVLVGVEPKTREVRGVGNEDQLDEIQQKITNRLRSTKLVPTPSFDVQAESYKGKYLIKVIVEPYPVPPVVMVNGQAWVRQGTTTRRATDADLHRLQERRPERSRPFDIRPFPGAQLSDLGHELKLVYEEAESANDDPATFPSYEQWLTQRQLGRVVNDRWIPNPAAILVYGISPQNYFPGATIEFVRYAGDDVDSVVSARKTITGSLPGQLDAVWTQLADHLAMEPTDEQGIRAGYSPRYPLDALKELARNLVQHRQYDGTNAPGRVEWFNDRIEFSNPGAPFGRASEGVFGANSDYRNPVITKELVALGYVEQLGRGIRRASVQLERNENPPIEVETNGLTRVIVRACS